MVGYRTSHLWTDESGATTTEYALLYSQTLKLYPRG